MQVICDYQMFALNNFFPQALYDNNTENTCQKTVTDVGLYLRLHKKTVIRSTTKQQKCQKCHELMNCRDV